MRNQAQLYQEIKVVSEVEDKDPHDIAVLLVDSAIDFCKQAQIFIREKKIANKGRKISQILDILQYLQALLDFEAGGEVARNIESILQFIEKNIVHANLENNINLLGEMGKLLSEVKDCFSACRA